MLTVLTSSQGLLTAASKSPDGSYAYNFATVPFFAEAAKFFISWYLLQRQKSRDGGSIRMTKDIKTLALFVVPSLIYMVHNNVQFFFLKYVDPATYQILGNLKIVSTGVLLRVALRRYLSPMQWMALTLLMVGATTSQINTDCTLHNNSTFSAPIQGYLFGLLSALLSAIAAVYTEWILKKNNDTLYWQNMQLYGFGILFNGIGLLLKNTEDGQFAFNPVVIFSGYSLVTWLVVANLAFSGLAVSWVMKNADSIVKVYATSLAMLLTTAVSVIGFGLSPTLQMALGITTASISVVLYYVNPTKLATVEPVPKEEEMKRLLPK